MSFYSQANCSFKNEFSASQFSHLLSLLCSTTKEEAGRGQVLGQMEIQEEAVAKAEMGEEQRQTVGSCPNSFCSHVEVWYIVSFGNLG